MIEDFVGKQLGAYRIDSFIGRGGMAFVYKAFQASMNRFVAIKILPYDLHNDQMYADLFKKEAQLIASLEHPHILPVYDYGEAEAYVYIVMRLIERGTLFELTRGVSLALSRIYDITAQVGDALDYAHSRDVIHRDIKPHNILIDERGNCWLADFGISKILAASSGLTSKGIIGTPEYMSPEQGIGKRVDARSDIYSLGVVLYEMVAGRLPFRAETPIATVFQHVYEPLPLPHAFNEKVPTPVEQVIVKALAKNPDDRYTKVTDMVKALSTALSEADRNLEFGPIPLTAPNSGFISSFTPPAATPTLTQTLPRPVDQEVTTPKATALTEAASHLATGAEPALPSPAVTSSQVDMKSAAPKVDSNLVNRLIARAQMGPGDYLVEGKQGLKELRAQEEEASRKRLTRMWEEERQRQIALQAKKREQQKQEQRMIRLAVLAVVVIALLLLAITLLRIS